MDDFTEEINMGQDTAAEDNGPTTPRMGHGPLRIWKDEGNSSGCVMERGDKKSEVDPRGPGHYKKIIVTRILSLLVLITSLIGVGESKLNEKQLKCYLKNIFEVEATRYCYKANVAEFNYETDIDNAKKFQLTTQATLNSAAWQKNVWCKYFRDATPDDYKDPCLKRQIRILHTLGNAALDAKKLEQLTNIGNEMTAIYSTGKICPYTKQNCNIATEGLTLEPGIEQIFVKSKNYDELLYAWTAWRNVTGAKMKHLYKNYVDLSNEAAKANNFTDKGAIWRDAYEDENFIQNIDKLWKDVEPLYIELHKYAGKKLKERYGDKLDLSDGLLPAHIFGNMWAQEWNNIADILKPYPEVSKVDVDAALKDKGYTIMDLFTTADDFYQSLGLLPNQMCYDECKGAMIRKPKERNVLCHASAWDFCDGKTYRLKMCTIVSFENFLVIHHEMGHIEYFQLYKNQPYAFRDGANPGFHEAIGDTIALSVSTPKHLQKINLLTDYTASDKSDLNALMDMALMKIAFLPYGLLIDKWRWDVFDGSVKESEWNSHYWKLREKYQKIKAPIKRCDTVDLDPAAKFHVAGDSQYIAYFVAHIVQFQFYKSLCTAAGEYSACDATKPLHNCDFYKSKKAGDILRTGLSLGSSEHWSDVLEKMTGERALNASALLEYFDPLYKFLLDYNSKSNCQK